MKNPAPFVRKALYALLNNAIVYNSVTIPVFEGEGEEGIPYQILVKDFSDADKSNKSNFRSNADQAIEIVAEQNDATLKNVDAIGELVMNAIKPSTSNIALASDTNFQIMVMGKPTQNHIREDSDSGVKIVRLRLKYNFLIIER